MPSPTDQLDLFGPDPQPIGPAAPDAEVHALARQLDPRIHLGTSSWSFPGWAGLVYDRAADSSTLARHGLAAYGRHPLLRTVGIDRSFYAPLGAEAYAAYAAVVPAGFRFLVKAPAACTSPILDRDRRRPNPLFLDPRTAAEAVEPMRAGLGDKAGPFVFQFPPLGRRLTDDPAGFADRLHGFLAALPEGPLYAVELRDAALFTPAYAEALAATGVRHCIGVHPRMPPVAAQAGLLDAAPIGPLVVRWSLRPNLGYEAARERYAPFDRLVDPDPQTRGDLAALALVYARDRGQPVFIVANNKAEGSAPLTLLALARAILDRA